jgi:hypothetical protein
MVDSTVDQGLLELINKNPVLKYQSNNINIFDFVFQGDLNSVEDLLNRNEKKYSCISEIRGYHGESLLTHAVIFPYNWIMVEFLINKGADIHFVDNKGFTILMYATLSIHKSFSADFCEGLDTLKYLIELGADYSAVDFKGRTFIDHLPLHKREEMQNYIDENCCMNLKPAKK